MSRIRCINAAEIEEGDLIAYLHGDAAPQVTAHIARCTYCMEQVERLRMVDVQLLAAFYRDACPAAEVLADFALNRLPATEKLRVAAHVRGCAACQGEVAGVRDLTDQVPRSLLAHLRQSLALALVARPVALAATPVRGRGWRGRFEVEDMVITLSSQAGHLTGRVRRRGVPPAMDYTGQAWLLSQAATEESVPHSRIDDRGRFHFTTLAAGTYTLLLQVGTQHVALETIQVE